MLSRLLTSSNGWMTKKLLPDQVLDWPCVSELRPITAGYCSQSQIRATYSALLGELSEYFSKLTVSKLTVSKLTVKIGYPFGNSSTGLIIISLLLNKFTVRTALIFYLVYLHVAACICNIFKIIFELSRSYSECQKDLERAYNRRGLMKESRIQTIA